MRRILTITHSERSEEGEHVTDVVDALPPADRSSAFANAPMGVALTTTQGVLIEAHLVHRSLHDPLTGLPNRILFGDRLRHALLRGHREDTPTCVLIIDLDGFKAINDRYGHPIGDAVLVAFADRLRSVLRASDTA